MSLGAGEITGIVTAITAVIGAITTFIYKVRGRAFRDIFKSILEGKSDEVKELAKVVQEQSKVFKGIVEKELDKKKPKK